MDNLVELVFSQTDDEIETVEEVDDEKNSGKSQNKKEKNRTQAIENNDNGKTGKIPPLLDESLKIGAFVRTAMENLSAAGYEFSDECLESLYEERSMHEIVGLSRNLLFFKRFVEGEEKGNCINGAVRYYAKPLLFGKNKVYLKKCCTKMTENHFLPDIKACYESE